MIKKHSAEFIEAFYNIDGGNAGRLTMTTAIELLERYVYTLCLLLPMHCCSMKLIVIEDLESSARNTSSSVYGIGY